MSEGDLLREAYPLTWPEAQPRTPASMRRVAAFKVGFARSRDDLLAELERLNAKHIIVSTNVPVRRDGLARVGEREPADPGVAVYFDRPVRGTEPVSWRSFVIACDAYRRVQSNLRAVGATVEALRAIQRHGATSMLEQAFSGFAQLEAARREEPWWKVLGVDEGANGQVILAAFRELAAIHHPDRGGDTAKMARINRAFDVARAEGRSR